MQGCVSGSFEWFVNYVTIDWPILLGAWSYLISNVFRRGCICSFLCRMMLMTTLALTNRWSLPVLNLLSTDDIPHNCSVCRQYIVDLVLRCAAWAYPGPFSLWLLAKMWIHYKEIFVFCEVNQYSSSFVSPSSLLPTFALNSSILTTLQSILQNIYIP